MIPTSPGTQPPQHMRENPEDYLASSTSEEEGEQGKCAKCKGGSARNTDVWPGRQ